ncbi:MAG: hypothetical protein DRJ42_03700 [Deltaproteobacteria bacterium]|nr:MAG: hypothetical protein DRJ42_03700 [Deltaproteobacteria bacterium]
MSFGSPGLTLLTDDEIKALLAALHHGHLVFPIRLSDLIGGGFPHIAEKAEIVSGLDERGLRALLVSVMAERRGG